MTPRGRGNRSRRASGGRKSASAVRAAVHRGPTPLLGRLGLWIGQRRPVGCRGLRLRPCVPGRDAAGETPRSRLLAGRTRSGGAANSSMIAASRLSWRFRARSISRSSRQRTQRKSPSARLRYAQRRQPPSATSAARRRLQDFALRFRALLTRFGESPVFLDGYWSVASLVTTLIGAGRSRRGVSRSTER